MPAIATLVVAAILAPSGHAATLQKQTVTQKFKILDIKAAEVSFSGTGQHEVRKDDDSGGYTAPHWQDNSSPPNGTGTDAGDRRFPVSFTGGSKITASAQLRIKPDPPAGTDVRLRALGPGFDFPAKAAAQSPGFLDYPATEATTALSAGVGFLDPMVLNWQVSVDGGTNWRKAGQTGNRVYATLADPVAGAALFETVLDIGARNAAGKATDADAVAAIWSDFQGPIPGVLRKVKDGFNQADGQEMRYWLDASDPNLPVVRATCQLLPHMVNPAVTQFNGVGTCVAWSQLFKETLRAQGISGAAILRVLPIYNPQTTGALLVKNWTFATTGTAPAGCAPFSFGPGEASDQAGAPGQGTANPPGGFESHFIVGFGGSFYDPSYGSGPFSSQAAWENASLDGFLDQCGSIDVFKKNDPAQIETTLIPTGL